MEKNQCAITSYKVRSLPPVIFQTMPVARSMPISNNGDWMAFNAASRALVLPVEEKVPQKICEMHVKNKTSDLI